MPQIPTHVKAKGCGQLVNRTLNFRKLANLKSDGQAKSSLFSYFCKNVPKVWLLDIHVQHLEWLQSESTTQVTHRIHNLLSLRVLDVFFSPTLGDLLWAPSTKLTAKGNQYISWWEMSARFQVSRVSPRVFGVSGSHLGFFLKNQIFLFQAPKNVEKIWKKKTPTSPTFVGDLSPVLGGFSAVPSKTGTNSAGIVPSEVAALPPARVRASTHTARASSGNIWTILVKVTLLHHQDG